MMMSRHKPLAPISVVRKPLLCAIGLIAASAWSASANAQQCACIQTNLEGAGEISGLVAEGSMSVTQAISEGFQATGSTVEESIGKQTSDIQKMLTAMTNKLVTELTEIPNEMQKIKTETERLNPAYHATDSCGYNKRTADTKVAERLTSLQEDNLNAASTGYNKMTSSYPTGVNPGDRFLVQTGRVLRDDPEIESVGVKWIGGTSGFGALDADDMQRASTFMNITTNPNPPQVRRDTTSIAGLKSNVEADLFNMRMSIAQAVQNQILSYRAPVVKDGGGVDSEDSWLLSQLANLSPDTAEAVKSGEVSVSKEDLIKLMANHRVQDAFWASNLAAKKREGVIKDLALVKADSLKMDYELWQQDRNMSLLMSQVLAAQVRKAKGGQ